MITEAQVRAVLREVEDPELPVSVVDLGLVRGVAIEGRRVTVRLTFTSIACPCTELLKGDVRDRVAAIDGVDEVEVVEVFEPWTRQDISEEGRTILRTLAVT